MGRVTLPQFIAQHHSIVLDTMVFIYEFEAHPKFSRLTHEVFTALEQEKCLGFCSAISLLEILIKPKREENMSVALQYYQALAQSPHLRLINVTPDVVDAAASVRVKYGLATPDAIVVATGLVHHATGLITADKRLKAVKEIESFVLQ